jgi:hypothetical protein
MPEPLDPALETVLAELANVDEADLDRLIAELADFAPDVAALLQAVELNEES